jgi:hypothetical protein
LNGALSVVAPVLATSLGSKIGFTAGFLTGVAAYGLGLLSIAAATRSSDFDVAARQHRIRAGQRL